MLKRVIEYVDYDGNPRKEDFYFHLNKAEMIQWLTMSGDYTLDKVMMRLVRERNGRKIMEIIEDIIKRSYGEKSLDGRQFVKSEELTRSFMQTEAYSILFTELVTNGDKAAEFISGIFPKEVTDEIEEAIKNNPNGIPDELKDYIPDLTEKK